MKLGVLGRLQVHLKVHNTVGNVFFDLTKELYEVERSLRLGCVLLNVPDDLFAVHQ